TGNPDESGRSWRECAAPVGHRHAASWRWRVRAPSGPAGHGSVRARGSRCRAPESGRRPCPPNRKRAGPRPHRSTSGEPERGAVDHPWRRLGGLPHGMLPLRRRRCNARLSCAVGSYVLRSDLGRPRGPRATLGCKTRRGVTFMNPKQRRQQGAVRPVALYGLGMSLSWGLGVAQQLQPAQPQAEPQLQEVVVTAQKRQQNIQTVPIAISAFTSQQLQQQNVTSLASLSAQTPGVTLDAGSPFSGDSSVLSASIRGIGQSDFAINVNPAVGVYLDGVYLARTVGANVNLLDVDRVEIAKGPQGTLFGANTIGGAISIITHTPGDKARFIGAATGGSFDRRDLAFTADIPIIPDKLLSSFTFGTQNQNGWQKVIPYPTSSPYGETPFVVDPQTAYPEPGYQTGSDYGGTGVTMMRSKVLFLATDRLKFTFTGDWTHENQTSLPNTVVGTFSGNLLSATFSTLYNLCIGNNAATLPGAIAAATTVPGIGPIFPVGSPNNALFGGDCSQPRAHVPGLSIGGAPLLGAGYVGGPPGPFNYNDHPGTAYLAASETGNIDTTYGVGPDYAKSDVFGFSLTGDYELNDELSVKSISGYRQMRWMIGTELDGTPETMFQVSDHQHQFQVSQEFQLLGKALDNKLNYVTGLYYFRESGYVHDY